MNKENEMRFVDSSNEDQNYSPVPSSSPSDGKLGGVRMVRIRLDRKCAPSECRTDKPYFQINSISAIDDNNPQNENEVRLFDAELAIPRCCPQPPQFNFFDTQSRQPYSLCRFDGFPINHYACCCCGERYEEFPNMITNLLSNAMDTSTTKCYDSRSFYRTFEYQGKAYYKIGHPYVKDDSCCCCKKKIEVANNPCCSCCKKTEKVTRLYVDIFNMSDQVVGQYVHFFDTSGCCCCVKATEFAEVYFPSDANELLKIALVGHLLFLLAIGTDIFVTLPGKKEDLPSLA